MRNNFLMLFGVLLLVSCTNGPQSLTYREQLDIYKDMKIRLYQVAGPVKIAGVNMCAKTGIDKGTRYHNLLDYPEKLRSVAQSYWNLTRENTVLIEEKSNHIATHIVKCKAPLILDYDDTPNAYTDGDSIYITPALLNEVDDLTLSLVIAHELAHIVLKHVDAEQSEKLERAADRTALYMLARADLDYPKAALQDVASKPPHKDGQKFLDTSKRAEYFRKVVAEIDKLKKEGKALVP